MFELQNIEPPNRAPRRQPAETWSSKRISQADRQALHARACLDFLRPARAMVPGRRGFPLPVHRLLAAIGEHWLRPRPRMRSADGQPMPPAWRRCDEQRLCPAQRHAASLTLVLQKNGLAPGSDPST